MRRIAPALAALALGGTAAPALAQSGEGDAPAPDMMEGSALDGDYIQVGI